MSVMTFWWAWIIAAVVILAIGVAVAFRRGHWGFWSIIVDSRGRCSLSKFQLFTWSVILISLFTAVALQRGLTSGFSTAIDFSIPSELLAVMGISVGSAAGAKAVKSYKDAIADTRILVSRNANGKPYFSQIFVEEEGALADQVVDIGKFQNFWITLLLVAAYLAGVASAIRDADFTKPFDALPGFSDQFITLLLISHAGYIAGKIPNRPGIPAVGTTLDGVRHP
jgi:hypothetical protein